MRPIFCGNVEFDARQSDIERLFRRYGRVERVDMKSGKLRFNFFFYPTSLVASSYRASLFVVAVSGVTW